MPELTLTLEPMDTRMDITTAMEHTIKALTDTQLPCIIEFKKHCHELECQVKRFI